MKNKTVLVTGAAGFIGSHLCEALLNNNFTVIGLDDLSSGREKNLSGFIDHPKFTFTKGSILDRKLLSDLMDDVSEVYHLAGKADIVPSINNPMEYHETNVTGTVNILEEMRAKSITKILYAASSSCYGIPTTYPTKETAPTDPRYPYALTKYLGEQSVLHWAKVYNMTAISLRMFNVYGPRSRTNGAYGAVIGTFLGQVLNNDPITIIGDGTQKRDFIHVKDIVSAFLTASKELTQTITLNVGAGNPRSVNQLVSLLKYDKIEYIPKRPGEPEITHADISEITKVTSWKPSISFEEGIGEIVTHIDEWVGTKSWTSEEIKKETKSWFYYLND